MKRTIKKYRLKEEVKKSIKAVVLCSICLLFTILIFNKLEEINKNRAIKHCNGKDDIIIKYDNKKKLKKRNGEKRKWKMENYKNYYDYFLKTSTYRERTILNNINELLKAKKEDIENLEEWEKNRKAEFLTDKQAKPYIIMI